VNQSNHLSQSFKENAMHSLQFGYCVPIFANPGGQLFRTPNYHQLDVATTMRLALLADTLGYHALWVADHLMLGKENAIMEGWTTLAALAGSTQRARLGMIHQGHFFRHPALVAKMVATLDQISGGRFIYFVDAGYGRQEHLAYGLPYPETIEERVAQVVDGLQVTLQLWQADQPVSYVGEHFQIQQATCTPLPLQKPHPPVWFGEAHPALLQACARYGQGWNSVPAGLEELSRRLTALAAACAEQGRSIDELEKSLEIQILIAPDRATLRQQLQAMIALSPPAQLNVELQAFLQGSSEALPKAMADTWLIGTPDEVAERLQLYVGLGITHFLLWFVDVPSEEGMRLFAEQVMPRFG
jgi:alkanesulfonate monooxygenase SsuD/methylene tetrahydromethanopterin reductase-like flavin-dependent oxidoreductase (luciferase family)